MFALSKLLSSVATLAQALAELAQTVTLANGELRRRLVMDGPETDGLAAQLPGPSADGEQPALPAGTGKRGRKTE